MPKTNAPKPVTLDKTLSASHSMIVAAVDTAGTVLAWNSGAATLLGYTAEEVVGSMQFDALLQPENAQPTAMILEVCETCRKTNRGLSIQAHHRTKAGHTLWISWRFEPVMTGRSKMQHLLAIGENISSAKMTERAMADAAERYSTLVNLLPDIVIVIDIEGIVTFVNESVRQLGYDPDELIGKHYKVLIHPEDFQNIDRRTVLPRFRGRVTGPMHAPKLFDERRSGMRKTENLEVRLVSRKGIADQHERVAIISSVNAAGLYDAQSPNHEFIGTIGIIRDITDRKQVEQEKVHLETQLNHSRKLEAIGQLAGGIAHDFNNMLSGITGYAEVIKQHNTRKDGTLVNNQLESDVSVIMRAAQRATDLTTKLLAFSRQGKYQVIPVSIHERVKEVIALLAPAIDRRIAITTQLSAPHATVLGDPTQLTNAVLNLAMNAADAMPQGGSLVFETQEVFLDESFVKSITYHMDPGAYLLLVVRDTGVGMSETTLQRIFEPFFTTKDVGKGTGLGLASVYGTVKGHHGSIEVESAVGKGTTFRIYLPVCDLQEQVPEDRPAHLTKGSGTVLVVDDEDIVRSILLKLLEEIGYAVVTCNNGGEAVSYYSAHSHEVDVVILDMNMPVMSGADCFRALRKINPSVKVIISTGYTIQEEAQKLVDSHVTGLIQKPFKFEVLAREVNRVLSL